MAVYRGQSKPIATGVEVVAYFLCGFSNKYFSEEGVLSKKLKNPAMSLPDRAQTLPGNW